MYTVNRCLSIIQYIVLYNTVYTLTVNVSCRTVFGRSMQAYCMREVLKFERFHSSVKTALVFCVRIG